MPLSELDENDMEPHLKHQISNKIEFTKSVYPDENSEVTKIKKIEFRTSSFFEVGWKAVFNCWTKASWNKHQKPMYLDFVYLNEANPLDAIRPPSRCVPILRIPVRGRHSTPRVS